jgi:hypothetical protein
MLQSPVSHERTSNRAAALQSATLMRATIADMRAIIEKTKILIDDGREAMLRADVVLRTSSK